MIFSKTFCSSPWFHMRITSSGTYEPCRWMSKDVGNRVNFERNITSLSPLNYFQKHMSPVRYDLLQGQTPAMCNDCYGMEQHNKPSGRQRQLLKVGIQNEYFEKSLASSPLRVDFDHSLAHEGDTERTVSDWQIDLGNYCNGACIFCHPESSSTLATEFQKIGFINKMPPRAWCDDPTLLDQFITDLKASKNLQYLHFLGGETVITPAFKKILQALVDSGLATQITIGFTTNLTVWADSVVELLKQFSMVNLGLSIESLTAVNDYVRYPSQQQRTRQLLDQWIELGRQQGWLTQIRTTPTCLTVQDLDTVYEYAWTHKVSVESCNFLNKPEFLRISVLPELQRKQVCKKLKMWIDAHPVTENKQIINTRDPNVVHQQIIQDAQSYLNYLESSADESHRLPDLVGYLRMLEKHRGNSILTYLPQYEELFRSAGY